MTSLVWGSGFLDVRGSDVRGPFLDVRGSFEPIFVFGRSGFGRSGFWTFGVWTWTVENEFISPVIKKSWILKMVYGKHLLYFSDF